MWKMQPCKVHKYLYNFVLRVEAVTIFDPKFETISVDTQKAIVVPMVTPSIFIFSDFAWSPGDNVISYWLPEIKDTPARVTIMAIPSRRELRVKNLFNVATVRNKP